MKTRLILLFAICFQTIHYSFEASFACSENTDSYSTSSKPIHKYHDCEMEHNLFNIGNNSNSTMWIGHMIAILMEGFTPYSHDNPKCTEDGNLYKEHLIKQDLWAVQMYASSAKYPGGLLTGITYEMGHYDQCLRAQSKELNIYSAYVLPNIRFGTSQTAGNFSRHHQIDNTYWALCIPDSCNAQDVQISVEELLTPTFQRYNVSVKISVNPALYTSNRISDAKHTDGYLIAFCLILILIILLNIFGTLYEMNVIGNQYVNSPILKTILRSFSIRTSINQVFQKPKESDLAAINGLKTYCAIIIVCMHRVFFTIPLNATVPPYFMENLATNFRRSWMNLVVVVEIFFVISGFFMYITVTNRLNKNRKLNIFYLFFYRIARLLPVDIIVLLLFVGLLPHMGDGPLWKLYAVSEAEKCRKNWWKKILFIDTYSEKFGDKCMLISWSVNCEVHFYAIGALITYAIWKWQKIGLWILGIMFAASIYIPAMTIYTNNITGILSYREVLNYSNDPYVNLVYIKSHQRITTYLIGIAAAHIYTKLKRDGVKISARKKTFGYFISQLLIVISVLATASFNLPGIEYNVWHHVLYFTLHRIVIAICVSYIIVVNAICGDGCVVKFFKSHFFSVMGNLTYSMYLCHHLFQAQSVSSIRTLMDMDKWILSRYIISDVMMSMFGSLLIVLLFEMPCQAIRCKLDTYFQKVKNQPCPNTYEKDNEKKMKIG
ncbi:uncharacterized protein LOC126844723 isoform X3 [Adelges cooleyi]|uniref:uncharacterized protein LOC126844723 isoform X3 n=1 Tax=Adelges cooleyi TaxID=133065 RepID=UPI00217FCAF4|nr:uncharacterized protein LOC126844723 isoform X3 [Adelges cooleyi]XP_050439068.1 uncharacterized protein LOC126844723 isoform X3 [Adelges cooleyi]XP_050439069.1 uncharacterized protein LOC126844723 isoform X3 [Adelges cooleyi]XP_050439070.1 uncharacterized protein LOC126844723 isoform X3 [Adelges cooleyi]XP_050439073.1 uncharacterized protein LOC126844723 isoform X3 [Adelges cooleyi]